MATLYHQVWIDAPVAKVYEALSSAEGLGRWWAPHTSTKTDAGVVLAHDPGEGHGEVKMKVVDLVKDTRVEWEIVSKHPAHSPASAWIGTRIAFDLGARENPGPWMGVASQSPRLAVLEFRHSGWDEASSYFGFCNFAWGETLLELKRACETR